MTNSIYCKIFNYIHKNLFAPQAQDLLEKLAEILLYNFHREHILLKLKIKKLLRKIKSKNLTAGVFFFFFFFFFFNTVVIYESYFVCYEWRGTFKQTRPNHISTCCFIDVYISEKL